MKFVIFECLNTTMKIIFSIYLVCAAWFGFAQVSEASMKPSLWLEVWDQVKNVPAFNVLQIGYNDIPRQLAVKGVFVEALEFTDKNGLNLMVCTQTGKFPVSVKNDEGVYEKMNDRAELNFYHFVKAAEGYKMLAEFSDEQDCDGFDLYNGFTKKALSITDLDKNGLAEISFQVVKSCRSDVSPAERKLFIFEAGKVFYIQGETTLEGQAAATPIYSEGTKECPFIAYLTKKWKQFEADDFMQFN